TVRLSGAQLRRIVADNLAEDRGILSIAGLRVRARCRGGALAVSLVRPDGSEVGDGDRLSLLTSDFLAHGGDRAIARLELGADAITIEDGPPLREAVAAVLSARGGT